MLKDVKDVRKAEVDANDDEDAACYPANPPFKLCKLVKCFSNRLGAKGYKNSE